jgi:hypothetical protein
MVTRVSPDELVSHLLEYLKRVHEEQESFAIVDAGEVLATLNPATSLSGSSSMSWSKFLALIGSMPPRDEKFANDHEEVHSSQEKFGPVNWHS